MLSPQSDEMVKAAMDVISFLALVGWFAEALPAVATLLTVFWTAIRILETETVQRWLKQKSGDN